MLVVAAIVSFLSIAALVTSQVGRFAFRQQSNVDLTAAADAALEYAYAQWQISTAAAFRGQTGGAPVTATLPSTTTLNAAMNGFTAFSSAGLAFSNMAIRPVGSDGVTGTTGAATGIPTSNVPGYPGWAGNTYGYVADVTVQAATLDANGNPVTSTRYGFSASSPAKLTAHRYFQVTQVPLFQAAIFYENKLEIHPGAAMTVSGLVHTNSDLWARGFSTLQFKSNVSYVGTYNEIGDASVTKGWDGSNGGIIPGRGFVRRRTDW